MSIEEPCAPRLHPMPALSLVEKTPPTQGSYPGSQRAQGPLLAYSLQYHYTCKASVPTTLNIWHFKKLIIDPHNVHVIHLMYEFAISNKINYLLQKFHHLCVLDWHLSLYIIYKVLNRDVEN